MTTCVLCQADFETQQHTRWIKDGFHIVQCPDCSLSFRAHLPKPEELSAVYDDSYFASDSASTGHGYLNYVEDESMHRNTAQRRLQTLRRFCPEAGRLLDVGCASGFFLHEATAVGWQAHGVEISPTMVQLAQQTYGLSVTQGLFADAQLPHSMFDCITMWDYIEHTVDPVRELRKAQAALRPGGIVALSTGDITSLVAKLSGKRWHLLTPEHHNYYFSPTTLRRLLATVGFEVVVLSHPGQRYPVRYLAHKLRTVHDGAIARRVTQALRASAVGAVNVPVNLWDIMTVYARKR